MKINLVVSRLARKKFSGGILCIFEYAHGLMLRGHEVTIVPTLPCDAPEWFSKPAGQIIQSSTGERVRDALAGAFGLAVSGVRMRKTPEKQAIRDAAARMCLAAPASFPLPVQMGLAECYTRRVAPLADVNLATSFETARVVRMLPGKNFYFAQHFEPLFHRDYADPVHAELTARQSYHLGLNLIANSSWLQQRLQQECPGAEVALCPNAIDHEVFKGEPRKSEDADRVVIISYGGRNAEWKGFAEMVEAVAMVRKRLPEVMIEWRVYGDALIPPSNHIAPYTSLGFLSSARLAEEYRKADILLSASWYESFPLFPIEAMACGLAVVTTQPGTEEYAIPSVTAEVVEPRNPSSIADGLTRLIRDPDYRFRLAQQGNVESHRFNWSRSVDQMEQILSGVSVRPESIAAVLS